MNDVLLIFLVCTLGFGGLFGSLYLIDRGHKAQARIGEPSSLGKGPPGPLRGGAKRIAEILGIVIVLVAEGVIYGGGVSVGDLMLMTLVLVVAVLAARALKI